MITGSRQLMDHIKNLVGTDSAKAQAAMRLYAMERFLDRLAHSPWKRTSPRPTSGSRARRSPP